jgi:hypothetical protein
LSVFLLGGNHALYRYDQQGPGGPWSLAPSMGGEWNGPPVVAAGQGGNLSVFLIGNDGALYRYDQIGARGTLDVFGRNAVGELIHYYWSRQPGWAVENLTQYANIGAAFQIASDPR